MYNRIPLYPGRVKLTPVGGDLYDMERADQPTQEGTPLNKATLLSDETAALIWKNPTGAETVSEALAQLPSFSRITETHPVAEGHSVSAGDVVDVNEDGEVVNNQNAEIDSYIYETDAVRQSNMIWLRDNIYVILFRDGSTAQIQIVQWTGRGLMILHTETFSTQANTLNAPLFLLRMTDEYFIASRNYTAGYPYTWRLYLCQYSNSGAFTMNESTVSVSSGAAYSRVSDTQFVSGFTESSTNLSRLTVYTVDYVSNSISTQSTIDYDSGAGTDFAITGISDSRILYAFQTTSAHINMRLAQIDASGVISTISTHDTGGTDGIHSLCNIGNSDILLVTTNSVQVWNVSGDVISSVANTTAPNVDAYAYPSRINGNAYLSANNSNPYQLSLAGNSITLSEMTAFQPIESDLSNYDIVEQSFGSLFLVGGSSSNSQGVIFCNYSITANSYAIALADAEAGQNVEIALEGLFDLPGITQGQEILDSRGYRIGYGYADGKLRVENSTLQNLFFVIGSYTGTGSYGKSNPNRIELGFYATMIFICGDSQLGALTAYGGAFSSDGIIFATPDTTGISWYSNNSAAQQLNSSGKIYGYIAFR